MVQPPMAQPPTCTCDRANRSALRRLAVYLYHARLMETNRLAPSVQASGARGSRIEAQLRCSTRFTPKLDRACCVQLSVRGRAIGKQREDSIEISRTGGGPPRMSGKKGPASRQRYFFGRELTHDAAFFGALQETPG